MKKLISWILALCMIFTCAFALGETESSTETTQTVGEPPAMPDGSGTPPDGMGNPPDGMGTPPDGMGNPPDGMGTPPTVAWEDLAAEWAAPGADRASPVNIPRP